MLSINDMSVYYSHFRSINIEQPLQSQINKKELARAGYSSQQISALLGNQLLPAEIRTLVHKLKNAESGILLEIQSKILKNEKEILNRFANTNGINFKNIPLNGHVVSGGVYPQSQKLIIIYGDNHVSAKGHQQTAAALSYLVKHHQLNLIGSEQNYPEEIIYDKVAQRLKSLNEQAIIQKLAVEEKFQPEFIVEVLHGKNVDTYGIEDAVQAKRWEQAYASHSSSINALTDSRSVAMISNLIKLMDHKKTRTAGLVAGLAHLPKMIEELKNKKISYIVIIPHSIEEFDQEDARQHEIFYLKK